MRHGRRIRIHKNGNGSFCLSNKSACKNISGKKEQNAIYLCFIQLFQWEKCVSTMATCSSGFKSLENNVQTEKAEVRLKNFNSIILPANRYTCARLTSTLCREMPFCSCRTSCLFYLLCIISLESLLDSLFLFSFSILWTTCESCHRLFSADSFSCYVFMALSDESKYLYVVLCFVCSTFFRYCGKRWIFGVFRSPVGCPLNTRHEKVIFCHFSCIMHERLWWSIHRVETYTAQIRWMSFYFLGFWMRQFIIRFRQRLIHNCKSAKLFDET